MHSRWAFVALASFFALAILTALVVVTGPLPGEWALVRWALTMRSDTLTRVIW